MKIKIFLCSTLLAFFGTSANAQNGKLELGLQGGPSIISMYGNDLANEDANDPAIGFAGNLTVQYNLTDRISLRLDPGFERKGSKTSYKVMDVEGNEYGTLDFHTNFNYITLPLLVRAYFGEKRHFFVNAGGYASYLASASQISRSDEFPQIETDNFAQYHKDFDFGVTVGAGFALNVTERIGLSLEARNNIGLYNISNTPVLYNGSIKTNATSLLAGISYKI